MLLRVIDGEGATQTIVTDGQETVVDRSGEIAQDQVAQNAMDANTDRSGWYFYNPLENDAMWVNDLGPAAGDDALSFYILPGGRWPPEGYPLSTGALSVIGTVGQKFLAREW